MSPWYGEAEFYEVSAPGRGALVLHPSRVVRFLGNPWPDPSVAPTPWSDSVLQALYDAVHAVAGATSLMHEAKVDIVTVPNLSEHLSSAETTAQLSARFGYAAAMKSINNLLLIGDGENRGDASPAASARPASPNSGSPMATLVLRSAGAALGTALGGPVGGLIGGALGAVGGGVVDGILANALASRRNRAPKRDEIAITHAEEGTPVRQLWGRMRLGGNVIWCSQFQAVQTSHTNGV